MPLIVVGSGRKTIEAIESFLPLSHGLPTDPEADGKPASWWGEATYRLKMNLIPNSVGRSYANTWLFDDLACEASV